MNFDQQLEIEWKRGYACAVASLIRMHGPSTKVDDLIKCGLNNLRGVDPYDREVLAPEIKRIKRTEAARSELYKTIQP